MKPRVAVKAEDPRKAEPFIHTEHEMTNNAVSGAGKADYVITLGKRMVIVIEAKKCDMSQALRQNFAAMEVARLLNARVDRQAEIDRIEAQNSEVKTETKAEVAEAKAEVSEDTKAITKAASVKTETKAEVGEAKAAVSKDTKASENTETDNIPYS